MDRSREEKEEKEMSVLTFRTEGFKERPDGPELDRRRAKTKQGRINKGKAHRFLSMQHGWGV